jgi:hypothetical protein
MVFSPPKIQIFLVTMRYFPTPPEFSQPGVQSLGRAGPAEGYRCLSDPARPGRKPVPEPWGGGQRQNVLKSARGFSETLNPETLTRTDIAPEVKLGLKGFFSVNLFLVRLVNLGAMETSGSAAASLQRTQFWCLTMKILD